jgi:hypothetical protein
LKDEYSRRIYDLRWPYISQSHLNAQEEAKRGAEATKSKAVKTDADREKAARDDAAREVAAREEAIIRATKDLFRHMFVD